MIVFLKIDHRQSEDPISKYWSLPIWVGEGDAWVTSWVPDILIISLISWSQPSGEQIFIIWHALIGCFEENSTLNKRHWSKEHIQGESYKTSVYLNWQQMRWNCRETALVYLFLCSLHSWCQPVRAAIGEEFQNFYFNFLEGQVFPFTFTDYWNWFFWLH